MRVLCLLNKQSLFLAKARNKRSLTSYKQSGQALLIILLVMSVVLTIGLSIASRSITDIAVSRQEEESSRAFSAAEAGIERFLLGGPATGTLPAGGGYKVSSGLVLGAGSEFVYPVSLNSGEVATVWLVSHDDSGGQVCGSSYPCFKEDEVKICWGASGTADGSANAPALEVSILYTDGSGRAKIARGAYDPNSSRRTTNKFSPADPGGCSLGGTSFAFGKSIDIDSSEFGVTLRKDENKLDPGPRFLRLRMLYNTDRPHPIGISVDDDVLPRQGTKVESTGNVGDITRKIELSNLYSDLPPIFEFGLFSGGPGGLTK